MQIKDTTKSLKSFKNYKASLAGKPIEGEKKDDGWWVDEEVKDEKKAPSSRPAPKAPQSDSNKSKNPSKLPPNQSKKTQNQPGRGGKRNKKGRIPSEEREVSKKDKVKQSRAQKTKNKGSHHNHKEKANKKYGF